jgi:hypothetical protein
VAFLHENFDGLLQSSKGGLGLVFEHVQLGSLYNWVHQKVNSFILTFFNSPDRGDYNVDRNDNLVDLFNYNDVFNV